MRINIIKFSSAYTYIQAIFFIAYAIFILSSALITNNIERFDTLILELIFYVVISIIIFLTARGVWLKKKLFFTPFLIIQMFVLILALPLISDSNLFIKLISIFTFGISFICIVTLLRSQNRTQFS